MGMAAGRTVGGDTVLIPMDDDASVNEEALEDRPIVGN
jgi:hypothetical protein